MKKVIYPQGSYQPGSQEALCCVLEHDTLSSAKYWFNPGNVIALLENC